MIRLVADGEESDWRPVMGRLRGASLACVGSFDDFDHGDAILFEEPDSQTLNVARRFLSGGKHVLLTANAAVTREVLESLSAAATVGQAQLAVANPEHFLPSRKLIRQHLD